MSKEKHKKTNALRILDTHKVPYSISEYEWSEERAAGLHVVEALGLDEKQVFKTLVGKGDKTGYVVFCIPVAAELDMKQAARVSHNKSVELVHVQGSARYYGLSTRRMFSSGNEKIISHIF